MPTRPTDHKFDWGFLNALSPETRQRVEAYKKAYEEEDKRLFGLEATLTAQSAFERSMPQRDKYIAAQQEVRAQRQRLQESFRKWQQQVRNVITNPILETSPAKRLTLGGGGLFRNLATSIKFGGIPEFRVPEFQMPNLSREKPEPLDLVVVLQGGMVSPSFLRFTDRKTGKEYTYDELVKGNMEATITPFWSEPMLFGGWYNQYDLENKKRRISSQQNFWRSFAQQHLSRGGLKVNPLWLPNTVEQGRSVYGNISKGVNWRGAFG